MWVGILGAATIEEPASQSRFDFGFDPFVEKSAKFFAEICDPVQTRQLKALERRFRRREHVFDWRLG
ncbi:MAG: hypothetical protein WBP79_00870 [Candidatus Acidiferrales bacterium]